MIGDNIHIKPEYLEKAKKIVTHFLEKTLVSKNKKILAIGGESGSGKSVTAFAIAQVLENMDKKCAVLQQDDYFYLPPQTNHEKRLESIDWVGENEVNFELLQKNIQTFLSDEHFLIKPLIDFDENKILSEKIDLKNIDVLILEGTYVLSLKEPDYKIFIDRNYKDTKKNRERRNRDQGGDFVEHVLGIEHQIIQKYKLSADLIIDKNYQIIT